MKKVDDIEVQDVLEDVLREEEAAERAEASVDEDASDEAEAASEAAADEDGEEDADPIPREHLDEPLSEEPPPETRRERMNLIRIKKLLDIPLYYERVTPPKQFTFYIDRR